MKEKQQRMRHRLAAIDKENFEIQKRRSKKTDDLIEERGGNSNPFTRLTRRHYSIGSKKSEKFSQRMAIPRKRAGLQPRDPDRPRD